MTFSWFPWRLENQGEARLILRRRLCAKRGLVPPPIPAAAAPLLVTSRLRDFGAGVRVVTVRQEPAWECQRKAGQRTGQSGRGEVRPRGAGRSAAGGGAGGRGKREGQRCGVQGAAAAPPRPAASCPVVPQRPARALFVASRRFGVFWCSARSYGSALLPGRLRRGRLRPGPHSVSLQPA